MSGSSEFDSAEGGAGWGGSIAFPSKQQRRRPCRLPLIINNVDTILSALSHTNGTTENHLMLDDTNVRI